MTRISKHPAALVTAAFLAWATTAAAQAPNGPPMGRGPGSGMGRPDPAYVQGQLDALHQRLRLAPQQEDAWQAFAGAVMRQSEQFRDVGSRMPVPTAPAPERFAFMAQMAQDSATALRAIADSMQSLYAVLGPNQRATVDREFAPGGPGGPPLR